MPPLLYKVSAKAGSPRIPRRALHRLVPSPSVANLGQGREVLSSPKPYTVTLRASIYFLFQKGHYLSGGKMAVLALDSKKQNPRLLSQKKKPRWWPKLPAVKGALVSLTEWQ